MEKTLESNGVKITYRLPNVLEVYKLQGACGWGREGVNGYEMIAAILEKAEPFIVKVEGANGWEGCLNNRKLYDDLSGLALSLVKTDLDDVEKNS